MQNAPAGFGDFRHLGPFIHFGKKHQRHGVCRIHRNAVFGEKCCIALTHSGFLALAEAQPPSDMQCEAFTYQPTEAFKRFGKTASAAFHVVKAWRVVIQAHAQDQAIRAEAVPQPQQPIGIAPHGLHGIGQHQGGKPGPNECIRKHVKQARIHERLATSEADLFQRLAKGSGLIQIGRHLLRRDIDKQIIARAAFDIAIGAGDVAERPGIDPKRLQALQRDSGAAFALGGHERVLELGQAAGRKADDGQEFHPFEDRRCA